MNPTITAKVGTVPLPQTAKEAALLPSSPVPPPAPFPSPEAEPKLSGTLRAYLFDRKNFLARLDERAETLHGRGYLAWATNRPGVFAVTVPHRNGETSYLVHAVERTCTCPFFTRQVTDEPLTEDGTLVECKHLRGLGTLVVKSGEEHKRCEDWKSYYGLRAHWIGVVAERRRRELGLAPFSSDKPCQGTKGTKE